MPWTNTELFTLDIYDAHDNLVEELSRHGSLTEARQAYDEALKKPRPAEHVVTLRLKAMVLRRSDRTD